MAAWIVEAWRYVALSPRSQWRQLQALRALDARLLRDVGISRIEAVVGRPLDMLDRTDGTGSGNMDNIRAAAAHVRVRDSMDADVSAIQRIYGHHVLHGAASFEEEPPSIEEMARRRHDVLQRGLPYLVAEREGKVVGYCYAGLYRTRAAYRHTVENSVYIDKDWHGHGIGRALLAELLTRCAAGGCRRVVAIIGDNSAASVALHRSQGFRMVGVLERVGFKFGRWIDTTLMQRDLDGGTAMDGAEPGR
ncbi:N-acetyltransferase family protein [Vineibacter terrae]|uniref:N-acetyltransferase family protein n=1 Tax=Vineibacter terrae TaxID=2586908 RepID=UPI002E2EB8CC|nr:N-acetyltransferase family protein [Vineibacter terrae]HEX2890849.1 GNAT family N-acetyltransferase [Vineibacter terrae]